MSTDRIAQIQGLRKLADWIEAHPELPKMDLDFSVYSFAGEEESKELATRFIKAMGTCEKIFDDTFFTLQKHFEDVNLRLVFFRNNVCEKKVVGYKPVPERVLEARPAQVIPAHEEPIYEYICPGSFLKDAKVNDETL